MSRKTVVLGYIRSIQPPRLRISQEEPRYKVLFDVKIKSHVRYSKINKEMFINTASIKLYKNSNINNDYRNNKIVQKNR